MPKSQNGEKAYSSLRQKMDELSEYIGCEYGRFEGWFDQFEQPHNHLSEMLRTDAEILDQTCTRQTFGGEFISNVPIVD